jgi:hypothetical protein
MARVKSGAAGEFNGGFKDGVLAKWKGLLISKAFPSPSSKPPVLSQLMQKAQFGLMTSFLSKMYCPSNIRSLAVAPINMKS